MATSADLAPVVVIPAFNAAATVARAVSSAIGQCPRVIVVDDGSIDATASVARGAGATVIRQTNAGPGQARNAALVAAGAEGSGLQVLFLDADDELLPGAARALSDALTAHPTAAAVIAGHEAVGPSGSKHRAPENAWLRSGTLPRPELALGPYHVFCTSGLTLAPGAAAALRFDPALHFAEDRDLIYRAAKLGPVAVIAGPLVRKHTGGGITDDPRRVHRWLADQLALAAKHCPPADVRDPAFDPLRECTDWVVKHALRTGARRGMPVSRSAWDLVRSTYGERGWPLSGVRRTYWISRLKSLFPSRRTGGGAGEPSSQRERP